jgi:hypothetical protein
MHSNDPASAPWAPPVLESGVQEHPTPHADPYNEDPYYPDPYAKL